MTTTLQTEAQREMLSLVTARVRDAYVRRPFYVEGGTDLVAVCRELSARSLTHALVRDVHEGAERLGIFTTTDLRDALLRGPPPQQLAVREVARFDIVSIGADADLFEALWLMVRHRVHRLVVRDGDAVLGVLGQLDLVSFVSNHSHIVALQIDDAASVADLHAAAARVDEMVMLLHGSGIRIERITRLVSELNSRLFARLWALLAPPEVVANTCLLVMGSEGRGEQILKTDQDNALLLRDGFVFDGLAALADRFNAALAELGYPPCPGDIMLTNPLWRQPLASFCDTIRDWIYGKFGGPTAEGPMHMAIFFDAVAVAGDPALLAEARACLERLSVGQEIFIARFAAAADQFQEPGNWFTRLTTKRDDQPLDLKKLGTFPIVHGVRALALQYGVREKGTAARLTRLVALRRVDETLAADLVQALHLLMGIRLTHQLRQREQGRLAGNEVRPSELSTLEREPLHNALAIVKSFRQFLRQHFRLGTL
jgi:CBS domain-containing protein